MWDLQAISAWFDSVFHRPARTGPVEQRVERPLNSPPPPPSPASARWSPSPPSATSATSPPSPPSPPTLVQDPPSYASLPKPGALPPPAPPPISTLAQYVIDAYVDLVHAGVLENGGALADYNQGQRTCFGQPEQDPLGVLTATLFFLRFHEVDDLSWKSRQSASVVLTAFHKISTSQRSLRRAKCVTVERVVRRFLLPKEEAFVRNLDELVQNHPSLECHLAWKNDLLHFWQTSPMAGVEERLWQLLNAHHLTEQDVIMLRGVVFFFLANALLDGHYAKNFETYRVYDMGCGTVGLAVVCARRAWHRVDQCDDLVGRHRRIAIKLLEATRRTQALRVGAYCDTTSKHSAASCVAAPLLEAVATSFAATRPPTPTPPRRDVP